MTLVFFVGALGLHLLHGLRLASDRQTDPVAHASNSTVFHSAFLLLNKTLRGSCYYVKDLPTDAGLPKYNGATDGDIPPYGLVPADISDLQKGLMFASLFGLKVNMKVNGHSTWGQSAAALPHDASSTMLFYMRPFSKVDPIVDNTFADTCGTHTATVVKMGGGVYFQQLYRALKGQNYTFHGGSCSSVAAGGGYSLGSGMSYFTERHLGMAINVILQYTVMLSTGQIITVDRCSHPTMFKALRGGGGGFAITTELVYPLYPGSQLQLYYFSFPNTTSHSVVNRTRWWELVVKHTIPIETQRWMIDPGAFSATNFGYLAREDTLPGYEAMQISFLGSAEEAEQTATFQDFYSLMQEVPSSVRNFTHRSWSNYVDFKEFYGSYDMGDGSGNGMKDLLYHPQWPEASGEWLIPLKYLKEEPAEAARLFERINKNIKCNLPYYYQLGGHVIEQKVNASEVCHHPSLYDAAFNVGVCDLDTFNEIVRLFPAETTGGPDIQHMYDTSITVHKVNVPLALFGRPNYEHMLRVKQLYDPGNIFGCKDCVAWPPHLAEFHYCIYNPMYSKLIPSIAKGEKVQPYR